MSPLLGSAQATSTMPIGDGQLPRVQRLLRRPPPQRCVHPHYEDQEEQQQPTGR
jgi:hypothetical protein